MTSGAIPVPASETVMQIQSPGGISVNIFSLGCFFSACERLRCTSPPFGIASRALTSKFISACWMRVGSALAMYDPVSALNVRMIFSGMVWLRILTISLMKERRSRGAAAIGVRRLKSKICWISWAAFWDSPRIVSKAWVFHSNQP